MIGLAHHESGQEQGVGDSESQQLVAPVTYEYGARLGKLPVGRLGSIGDWFLSFDCGLSFGGSFPRRYTLTIATIGSRFSAMAISNAKRRRQSANIIAARKTINPTSAIATGDGDNMRTGMVSVRNVMATSRESIKQVFNAPRLVMGEYVPAATHAAEYEKMTGKGWNGE